MMSELTRIITKHLGMTSRMIAYSKSSYKREHPNNIVYFNACIFDSKGNQIWWGDVDITLEKKVLQRIAEDSGEIFYITPEHPFRTDFNKVTLKDLENSETSIIFKPGRGPLK